MRTTRCRYCGMVVPDGEPCCAYAAGHIPPMDNAPRLVEGALVPVREIARRSGISHRGALRRLRKVDARIGGGLLVRFGNARNSHFYVNLRLLQEHAPSMIGAIGVISEHPPGAMRSAQELTLDRVLEELAALRGMMCSLDDALAAIRDNVSTATSVGCAMCGCGCATD